MNATRAAALPRYRTDNPVYRTGKPARLRPDLRVIHRAGSPAASASSSVTAPSAAISLAGVSPVVASPAGVSPATVSPAGVSSATVPLPATGHPAVLPLSVARPAAAPLRATPRPSSAASPLRLTRRGRIVVAVTAALLAAGLSLAIAGAAQATSHPTSSRATSSDLTRVVVHPGQTLWSVAQNADPNADPRSIIQQIVQLNALTSESLVIGQRLWVPRS